MVKAVIVKDLQAGRMKLLGAGATKPRTLKKLGES
jgi:hypothetical protein